MLGDLTTSILVDMTNSTGEDDANFANTSAS